MESRSKRSILLQHRNIVTVAPKAMHLLLLHMQNLTSIKQASPLCLHKSAKYLIVNRQHHHHTAVITPTSDHCCMNM
ncbi:hypothetical protein X798_06054, partial [Onchocerca flexuosa]